MSLVAVLALGMIAVWRQPSPRINPGTVAANTRAQRALVARQAEVTLASIGHALIEAAARTENIISKRDRSAVAE
ncbi:MAG TPA: hypothetical protein VHH73_18340 [Verrucomicrobiae bacterium]|nr:hypothetical protein [Verrucomicrobiae bacterium]